MCIRDSAVNNPHLPNSRYNNLKSEVIPMCNFPARRRYASALRLYYA